jgi:tRNA (guanine-N7-)-methyltransferase
MPEPFYRSLEQLLPWPATAKPLDAAAVFGRRAPLELEIGPGNGEYLAALAAERPAHDFLAVELLWGRVKKCLRKLGGAGLTNARLICGNIAPVLAYLVPPRGLQAVHTLFPCPWPGDTAGAHRLYRADFLRLVNSRLVDGGTVTLVTDNRPYFDWVLEQLPDTGFDSRVSDVGADYGTKFERKWVGGGQQRFHRLDLVKRKHQDHPLSLEVPMRSHVLDSFDPTGFRLPHRVMPEPGPASDQQPADRITRVVGKELLYDPARRQGLVRMVVVEPGLSQELWIEIAGLSDGRYRVAPARACHALLTDGVQLAVDAVALAASGA